METLVAISLVGNIVQFVDFSGKLISKSVQLYYSSNGALAEHVDIETATKRLAVLNKKLKDNATTISNGALQSLCLSCQDAANDLLAALDQVKVKDRQQKWESVRKALRSIWSREEIKGLEKRLAKFKEDLNFHVVVDLREQVSQLKREHFDTLKELDLATKSILDAIVKQQDVFQAAHEAQLTLTKTLHENTMRNIDDTRQEIILEIRRQQPDIAEQEQFLDKLPTATQAIFNSSESQHDPICLQNTRVGVIEEIRAWADGQDERCIFWLNGLAGTGKSTIARTIARKYFEQKRLGASFFFSRGDGDVGHARKFFTTIAVQLANKLPSLKGHICGAISENNNIACQSLHDQWRQLILQPLSELDGNSSQPSQLSYILIVDALDECEGENDIRTILHLLAEARSLKTVRLRIFLTSRPEVPIRYDFCQIPGPKNQDFVLHNIPRAIVDHDISIFLEYNLRIIRQERALGASWPGEQVIRCLVQNASGLFIWAATACRFIRDGKRFAARRLATILNGSSTCVTAPEKHLNEIYITVLKNSIYPDYTDEEKEDLYSMLRHILGCIVLLFSPLSSDCLSRLLHTTKQEVSQTLEDLHSILDIPKDQTRPIRLHHPSFRDFLLDKDRCGNLKFWVDKKQAHWTLADSCMRLMAASLKQDICGVKALGVLVTNIESSRVDKCLPPEVQYACLYWVQHLQKSGAQLHDNDQVHQFLETHLLHWLEALSWMRKVSEGILTITSLESIARSSDCSRLCAFIYDMKRFALHSRSAFEQAPLQIYCSALIFTPAMSIVRKQFEDQIPRWMQRLPDVQKDWSALLQTLEGHSGSVLAIAFSPDGKQLASASADKTIRLWDAATGAALRTLEGHLDDVHAVAFSPDGKHLASASWDETVRMWDAATGAALRTLEGHSGSVHAVAFSPNGKQLASASTDKTVWLWDAATGAALQTLKAHSDRVIAVAFSPDGKHLASASWDETVRMWDAATGAALQTLEGHSGSVHAVAFSPDGKQLASASTDETIRMWDATTGAALQTLEGHSGSVHAVAFSPDGKQLASASWDETIRLWDAATGATLRTLEGRSDRVHAVAFSPDGKQLASASWDETVRMWDATTGAALQTLEGHSDRVIAVVFSPNGKQLASASWDETVRLWDAATGAALQTLEGHLDDVHTVAFSPNGEQLASASTDETIRLWDAATGAALRTLEGHSGSVHAVAFSPDGKQLASASTDKAVRLWDAATGAALQTLEGHSDYVIAVAFSPDGKQLASASTDETIRMWDATTGAALQTLEGHSDRVIAVAFSLDGKHLASASWDETVRMWDAATGAALQTLKGHSDYVHAVAFSPNGKQLASASRDKTVRLWDAAAGAVLQELVVDTAITALSFSVDGSCLETDRGQLDTLSLPLSAALSRPTLPRGMFVKEQWVARGIENLLWLPSDYRATSAAVRGSVVVLGHASGRVSTMKFTF